ncbi:hypothetical protein CPLU01_05736 [Colletotrichum plurivorum]|uniref:Uncharacterized protein n=1 Tax=Colletotrichum plurivorum TaxID=2175906 RepID=A0A8H6KKJ8_9PEZI|nr:hypothetical protein CPLU01_05736 [Colletotrichum plurivorum]
MDDLTKQQRSERFENSYERDHRVRRKATVAGRIINESTTGVPAKLAADVGRKLRDYTTKQTSRSMLYGDCPVPFDKMELATVVAFRSMMELHEPEKVPKKIRDHFVKEKPQGLLTIDSWISHNIRSLKTMRYRRAAKFKEPGMRTGVYWGLEPNDIGRVADIEQFQIPINLSPLEKMTRLRASQQPSSGKLRIW